MGELQATEMYDRAWERRLQGDKKGYLDILRALVALEPDNCEYLFEYAEQLYHIAANKEDAGASEEAIGVLTTFIERCQQHCIHARIVFAHSMKLGLLEKCGRLFPAIAELTWLIEHGDPDQRHFDLQHRGLVKERLEMYEDAAKDFEQLFLENPDFVGARNHLVTCKYRAKRFEDVIKHTTDTINTLEPDKQSYQLALHLRGKAQLELGRLDLALKDFQRVRHLRGQYFEVSTLEDYPYLDQEVI